MKSHGDGLQIDAEYTTKSAYRIQFTGQTKRQAINPIWKAKSEPKCRKFAWILLHKKFLTANNLEKRGWPHDPLCRLCQSEPETPKKHLCKDCTYTQAVWSQGALRLIPFLGGGKCAEPFFDNNVDGLYTSGGTFGWNAT
jgi:hypothetical protein